MEGKNRACIPNDTQRPEHGDMSTTSRHKKKEGKETGVKWTYKRMIYMASGFFWMASFTVDMHRKMASSSN